VRVLGGRPAFPEADPCRELFWGLAADHLVWFGYWSWKASLDRFYKKRVFLGFHHLGYRPSLGAYFWCSCVFLDLLVGICLDVKQNYKMK